MAIQGHLDEAMDVFERALELEPEHPYALPNMGYVLAAAGRPEMALLYFRQNLALIREEKIDHAERGGILDVAAVLAAAGDTVQAREFADQAIAELEDEMVGREWSLDDHAYLAQLLAAAERFDEGEEQLVAAMNIEPDDGSSQLEVARTCAVLGHRECAIEATRKALEMELGDPYLPMLIPSMNGLLGDPEFMALFPMGDSAPRR